MTSLLALGPRARLPMAFDSSQSQRRSLMSSASQERRRLIHLSALVRDKEQRGCHQTRSQIKLGCWPMSMPWADNIARRCAQAKSGIHVRLRRYRPRSTGRGRHGQLLTVLSSSRRTRLGCRSAGLAPCVCCRTCYKRDADRWHSLSADGGQCPGRGCRLRIVCVVGLVVRVPTHTHAHARAHSYYIRHWLRRCA